MSEQEIVFADDGVFVGKLSKSSIQPDGLQLFVEQYNELLGSVKYQPWLRGVMAGLSLAFGVPTSPRLDPEEISPTDDIEHSVVELTGDGSGEAAPPLGSVVASEETPGLTPPGSPGSPGNAAAVGETIVPVSESPAAVGESIPAVSESPAVPSGETPGLTPPGSPEAVAAAEPPKAPEAGVVSP